MSEPITPQELAEEVVRLYYGVEPSQKVARANLTGIIVRVLAPRIAELERQLEEARNEKA